jgi:hypothetical protein
MKQAGSRPRLPQLNFADTERIDASDLAGAIRGDRTRLRLLIAELEQSDRASVAGVLAGLIGHQDREVRGWLAWAAPKFLGAEAVPLLVPLADDRDADVRTEAMDALVELDLAYLVEFVPRYVELAKGDDSALAMYGILRLTRLRVPEAVDLFNDLALNAGYPSTRNHARIMALVLKGREDDILAGLEDENHELMPIWIKAALYVGSGRTLTALEEIARSDVHDRCRRSASDALTKLDDVRPPGLH